MARGAIPPGAAASPVQPIVNTRKNVPMNSTAYRRRARPFVLIVEPLPRPTSTNEASYRGAADAFRRRAPDFRPERRHHEQPAGRGCPVLRARAASAADSLSTPRRIAPTGSGSVHVVDAGNARLLTYARPRPGGDEDHGAGRGRGRAGRDAGRGGG